MEIAAAMPAHGGTSPKSAAPIIVTEPKTTIANQGIRTFHVACFGPASNCGCAKELAFARRLLILRSYPS